MDKNNSKIPTFLSQSKGTAEKSHSHPPDPMEEKPQNPSNTSSRGERCQELFFPPGVRREVLLLCPFFLTAPSRSVISTEQQQPFHLRQGHAGERGEEKKKKGEAFEVGFFWWLHLCNRISLCTGAWQGGVWRCPCRARCARVVALPAVCPFSLFFLCSWSPWLPVRCCPFRPCGPGQVLLVCHRCGWA